MRVKISLLHLYLHLFLKHITEVSRCIQNRSTEDISVGRKVSQYKKYSFFFICYLFVSSLAWGLINIWTNFNDQRTKLSLIRNATTWSFSHVKVNRQILGYFTPKTTSCNFSVNLTPNIKCLHVSLCRQSYSSTIMAHQ